MTRTVYVPASRIERWLDTYTTRHGAGPVTVDGQAVVVAGTDGATARLGLLWPGLQLGADPVADLLAAVRVRHPEDPDGDYRVEFRDGQPVNCGRDD